MKRLAFVLVLLVSCASDHGSASTKSATPQTHDLTVIVNVYDGYYSAAFPPKPKEACRNEPISSATQLSVADENGSLVGIGNFENRGELTDKLQNEVVWTFSTIVEHLPRLTSTWSRLTASITSCGTASTRWSRTPGP